MTPSLSAKLVVWTPLGHKWAAQPTLVVVAQTTLRNKETKPNDLLEQLVFSLCSGYFTALSREHKPDGGSAQTCL